MSRVGKKFTKFVERNGDCLLRYSYDGHGELPYDTHCTFVVNNCRDCHGKRAFECQVMPVAVAHLKPWQHIVPTVENMGGSVRGVQMGMEWASISIYACQ